MKSYISSFKDKVNLRGGNAYERNYNLKKREFQNFFDNTLTKEWCLVDGRKEQVVFQDHSQSNNKDLSDDKYIVCENSVEIGVGSYINWRDSMWMVFTEEYKTIATHQQLKIKHANDEIKWIIDGKICNNGLGYNAYVQSQTLYTMGVKTDVHISMVDSKMALYMQNNEQTASLKVDTRIFVGKRVYKIKFMDEVSRSGLIFYLLDEDTISVYDNVELSVADYYRDFVEEPHETPNPSVEIKGETKPKIGGIYKYELDEEGVLVKSWIVNSAEVEPSCVIVSQDEKSLQLQFKNDFRYVGVVTNILAELDSGDIISLTTTTIKKY